MVDQLRCVRLYVRPESTNLKYAEQHADIIRRFGRFPHRNAILGRTTTPEERSSSTAAASRAEARLARL